LYRSAEPFQYEIRIQRNNEKRRIVLPPTLWTSNKRLLVTDEDDVVEDDLLKYSSEHQMCIRRNNMEDESSDRYGRNLYGVLKLDMKDVEKKSPEEQDEIIRKAFRRQMFRFHPDRNPDKPVDNHLCQEITFAYSILGHREKRAQYNDLTKYSKGWLSKSRWEAIFKPEAHGKYEGIKRIGLLLLSAVSIGAGIAVSVMTAGLTAPIAIALNASIAGALIGGGIQSAQRTMSYDSIANGVSMKKILHSYTIGAAFGAVAGVATAGITSVMTGIGGSALPVAEVSISKMVQTGAANGCVNGTAALLASDADRAFVDGKDVTLKEVACHAVLGGLAGAAAGAAGGAITKAVHVSASAATVEGEAAEQGFNKFITKNAVKHAPTIGKLAEGAKRKILNTGFDTIEEKLKEDPQECSPKTEENIIYRVYFDPEEDKTEKICYVCNQRWSSRMIIEYVDATKSRKRIEVEGSGSAVEIPEQATNILVGFQAWRCFKWCDVKKYDRIGKQWCQANESHSFMFDSPVSYTFTLDGCRFYEHVSKITNEDYDEVDNI
jgi:hypothetical protein